MDNATQITGGDPVLSGTDNSAGGEDLRTFRLASLARQKAHLEWGLKKLDRLDHRFFLARLITLVVGLVVSLPALIYGEGAFGLVVSGIFILTFILVVVLHRRVDRRRQRFQLGQAWIAAQLARMQLAWEGIPSAIQINFDPTHPFASDLNLVGERSLHQLVDTATSRNGSQRLADWLLRPALNAAQIRERQAILQELLPLKGFRQGLALEGMLIKLQLGGQWDSDRLMGWLDAAPGSRSLLPTLVLLSVLAGLNIGLFILSALQVLPAFWLVSLTVYAAITLMRYRDIEALFGNAYDIGKALGQFRSILTFLETYPYLNNKRLARLCAPFLQADRRPSQFLREIVQITSAASLENNPFLSLLINTLLPWNFLFAHLLERYKSRLRGVLPGWLEAWYELEAMNSLANFLYLNPGYTFPEIVEGAPGDRQVVFVTRQLGHPLLRMEEKVCNGFSLDRLGEVALITGSNMSGKSTFLRTLGVNQCLAFAGGPVNAAFLRTSLFRVFTCIQVNDSLSYGISYFYAEVRRLKALLQGLEQDQYPLFFLIDEIFRGTNNRERRIGSQAYVSALTRGYGAGAISTHDLELVKLSEMGLDIVNYHFREEIRENRMVFDYRLRPGPSPTTNALKIMALEGLPVEVS